MRFHRVASTVEALEVTVHGLAQDVPRNEILDQLRELLGQVSVSDTICVVVGDGPTAEVIGDGAGAPVGEALLSVATALLDDDQSVLQAGSDGVSPTPAAAQRGFDVVPIVGTRGQPLGRCGFMPKRATTTSSDSVAEDEILRLMGIVIERHQVRRGRLDAVTRERGLIASMLHDDPIQSMTAVSLGLQRLSNRLTDPDASRSVRELRQLVDTSIDGLRHLMFALHPPALGIDGLDATIEAYLETFVEPLGLAWSMNGAVTTTIPTHVEPLAFRLMRSAILNTIKHAEATKIAVTVETTDDNVKIVVTDDGVGFDLNPHRPADVGHAGIAYAQDLASEVGGTYSMTSEPGEGTTVTISLPF